MKLKFSEIALIKTLIINLAIIAVWYASEYMQYNELQWDRKCDNTVGVLYFLVIWYLLYKIEKKKVVNHENES